MKAIASILSLFFAATLAAANITVTKTAEQIGTQYNWVTSNFYGTFRLDDVVTIAAHQPDSGSLNGYYSPDSPRDWRVYQARNNGEFAVSVRPGYIIHSLSLVYSNKNNGVLSLVAGKSIEPLYQVASAQTLQVDTTSITFYAGNTGTSGSGQVRISQFSVTYSLADTTAVVERFSKVDQTKNNDEEVTWQGDYADWQVLNARRNAKDTLNEGVQASWSKGGGYFKTTAYGGIKRLSFDWRQFVTDSVELVLAMSADTLWRDTARMQAIAQQAASKNYHYAATIQCKQDVQLSFMNLSAVVEKDRFLLGDLYITPYIYIAPENRSLRFEPQDSVFDVSTILQNNTEGEGEVVYTMLKDKTGKATISGSVVDFSQVTSSGEIQVQVSWNQGKVKLPPVTLKISAIEPEDEAFAETFSHCSRTQFAGTTYVVGDQQVYGWNFTHFAHRDMDTVAGQQGTLIGYNGGIRMNGIQEGGVKAVSFYWRAKTASQPVLFLLSVDGEDYDYTYTIAQSQGKTQLLSKTVDIAHNTAVYVTMGAKESVAQAEFIVGTMYITPYLLFRTRLDTAVLADSTTLDLAPMLINNTGEVPSYTILSDETGAVTLNEDVLDLSAVTRNGMVKVQAAWGDVTTTLQLLVLMEHPTALPATRSAAAANRKVMVGDQLYILRDDKTYSVTGAKR